MKAQFYLLEKKYSRYLNGAFLEEPGFELRKVLSCHHDLRRDRAGVRGDLSYQARLCM